MTNKSFAMLSISGNKILQDYLYPLLIQDHTTWIQNARMNSPSGCRTLLTRARRLWKFSWRPPNVMWSIEWTGLKSIQLIVINMDWTINPPCLYNNTPASSLLSMITEAPLLHHFLSICNFFLFLFLFWSTWSRSGDAGYIWHHPKCQTALHNKPIWMSWIVVLIYQGCPNFVPRGPHTEE